MKLTPLDIKKQEFKKVFRGYDTVEVDTFMDMLANEFEDLLRSQKEMRDRIVELEVSLKEYRQVEKSIQQTLLQAQETAARSYETARKEAEVILREAEMKGAKLVEQANGDLQRLTNEVMVLSARRDSLLGRLRILLSSELDLIRAMELGEAGDPLSSPSLGSGKNTLDVDRAVRNIDQ
jgi:cell division initiation protein